MQAVVTTSACTLRKNGAVRTLKGQVLRSRTHATIRLNMLAQDLLFSTIYMSMSHAIYRK